VDDPAPTLVDGNQDAVTLEITTFEPGDRANDQNEVQRLTFSTLPTAGSFQLAFNGAQTAAIDASAPSLATEIETRLEALAAIHAVSVVDSGSQQFDVTFLNVTSTPRDVPRLTPDAASASKVFIATVVDGIQGTQAVQRLSHDLTSGTFDLAFNGADAEEIPFDAPADDLADALRSLDTVVDVSVVKLTTPEDGFQQTWEITFPMGTPDVPQLASTNPGLTVETRINGVGSAPVARPDIVRVDLVKEVTTITVTEKAAITDKSYFSLDAGNTHYALWYDTTGASAGGRLPPSRRSPERPLRPATTLPSSPSPIQRGGRSRMSPTVAPVLRSRSTGKAPVKKKFPALP
jgi:hypothetical protein